MAPTLAPVLSSSPLRMAFAALFSIAALSLTAQVMVQVRDARTEAPVPYAHLAHQGLQGAASGMVVSGPDGRAMLPIDTVQLEVGVLLRISFVGYGSILDTLRGPGPRDYFLEPISQVLQEVVITGQYAPVAPEQAVHKVRVLDAAHFQRIAANNLADALRNELNIRLQQDNLLGTSLSMMGMGGENVKVLVDGVPVIGRLDGGLDLSQLDITAIERAEIIEGPLSVSYGTNALAGTINLITRKGSAEPVTFKAQVYAEHIGRLNTSFSTTRHLRRHQLSLNGGRNFFGGWDPSQPGIPRFGPAPADTNRVQQWKPREQYFGRLGYSWLGERWNFGYKGEAMYDLIVNRGAPRPPFYETAFDEQYTTTRMDNALFAEGVLPKGKRLNALAAHNRYTRIRNTWYRDLTTLGEQLADIPGMQDTTGFTLTNMRAVVSSRAPNAILRYELGTDVNYETGSGQRLGGERRDIGDAALFGTAEYTPVAGLTFRPGLRMAWNTRYAAPLLPSLNMRWGISEQLVARASYARGFRAPGLKEMYLDLVDVNHDIVGNPELLAENSHSTSAGLTYRRARARSVYRSELTGFYNAMTDLITLAQLGGASYTYVNIGSFSSAGGTAGASWDNGHWLVSAGAGITGRYDEISATQDEPWLFSSEARASLTRNWMRQGWTASFFWKFQGEVANYVQGADGGIVRGYIAPFHMADITFGKRSRDRRLLLSVGCKDLFDVMNVEASIAGGVHSSGAASVPMTTGRTWFLRLELDLKKKDA